MFLWLLYPIAWGVSEGGNVISPLKEMIFYGILDILAKPVFCFYHAWQISRIPYERFMLQSGKASVGAAAGYNQLDEKHNRNSTAGYAGPGAAATGAPGTAGVTGAGSALGVSNHSLF
jgi:bacteriorhodopsin